MYGQVAEHYQPLYSHHTIPIPVPARPRSGRNQRPQLPIFRTGTIRPCAPDPAGSRLQRAAPETHPQSTRPQLRSARRRLCGSILALLGGYSGKKTSANRSSPENPLPCCAMSTYCGPSHRFQTEIKWPKESRDPLLLISVESTPKASTSILITRIVATTAQSEAARPSLQELLCFSFKATSRRPSAQKPRLFSAYREPLPAKAEHCEAGTRR
jgi:hypothetical protein